VINTKQVTSQEKITRALRNKYGTKMIFPPISQQRQNKQFGFSGDKKMHLKQGMNSPLW
jgi:hypothetical protein